MNPVEPRPLPGRPASPCVGICKISPHDKQCQGCHRSLKEIADWMRMDEVQREVVWQRIEQSLFAVPGPIEGKS